MERIQIFLPSILIVVVLAGATRLYTKWVIKYRFGDNFKSVEWHKKNRWKVVWVIDTPTANVWAPAVEELIFRVPLIIAFSAMSSAAWYGVFASSGLFALAHWFGKKIWMSDILSAKEQGNHKSDNMDAEVDRLYAEKGKMIWVRKISHVVLVLPLGILAGYYGIEYQSVWVAFGIHSVWNLVMPTVLAILVLLGAFTFAVVSFLWNRVMWRWRTL